MYAAVEFNGSSSEEEDNGITLSTNNIIRDVLDAKKRATIVEKKVQDWNSEMTARLKDPKVLNIFRAACDIVEAERRIVRKSYL
jgi:hypothetical protein